MKPKWHSLAREFWIWIAIGLIVMMLFGFAVNNACSVPLVRDVIAEQRNNPSNQEGGAGQQAQPNNAGASAIRGETNRPTADNKGQPRPEISLCNTRIPDLGLIYLTFCLVVVGYFQIRRNEKSTRDLERAVLISGPQLYAQAPLMPGMQFGINNWTPAITIQGNVAHVHITLTNCGRTPAVLKEVFVQFSQAEPMGDTAIYGTGERARFDTGIPAGNNSAPCRLDPFISPHITQHYCFGYVKYEDIFHQMHTNRWCIRITPGTFDAQVAGSDAYNEWD
jgi:hypothetical protein